MSELHDIKRRIYNEERIEDVLELLECWSIDTEQSGKLYVAGLPDGDNKRSVQVKNTETLSSSIRSKGINGDIYDVISYILFNAESEEDRKNSLHKSKFWVCKQLNYVEFIDEFYRETSNPIENKPDFNNWLRKLKKSRVENVPESLNRVCLPSILDEFGIIPYKKWVDEGIKLTTQKLFGVGIDVKSDRVTFPIHNKNGELIGVKGRYCGKNVHVEDNYKYLYLYPCNKSIEFYNLHRAIPYIIKNNEVIIVEGAKTVMNLYQWGYRNVISIEGDSLSDYQIILLKELGLHMCYIFVWDKDKDIEFIKNEASKLKGRIKYVIFDKDNKLNYKDSPCDKGKDVWEKLYEQNKYRLRG
jgi:DNA primase